MSDSQNPKKFKVRIVEEIAWDYEVEAPDKESAVEYVQAGLGEIKARDCLSQKTDNVEEVK